MNKACALVVGEGHGLQIRKPDDKHVNANWEVVSGIGVLCVAWLYSCLISAYLCMEPIDRPFRFTWDFCLVWALLVLPTFLITHGLDLGPWYSYGAILILLPLFATFALYGPILIARQVVRSGAHGSGVLRILISIILAAVLLFVGLFVSGFYSQGNARILAFFFVAAAVIYLHWRTDERKP